MSSNKFKYINM